MLNIPECSYLRLTPYAFILCCMLLLLTATGCQSQTGAGQPSPAQQQPQSSSQATTVASSNSAQPVQNSNTTIKTTATTFDACSLLTISEIGSVQGDEITGTQAAPGNSDRLAVSQCYYQAKTPAKSVSLEVTRRLAGQANSLAPKEFWGEMFKKSVRERARAAEGKGEADKTPPRSKEEEKKQGKLPQKVAGVGDEAFWVGNRDMGALYALKGNTIIRISIGGVADQSVRLEKTKALAQLALKRVKD